MLKEYATILLEETDSVLILKLNRPEKLNAFNMQMLDDMLDAIDYANTNDNIKSLEKLVSKNILSSFSSQIKERQKKSEKLEITVISVKEPVIKDINTQKNKAIIKLFFDSEQVQLTKSKNNDIIEGDSNQILSITENWTFSKDMKSKDPNWTLEEIEESN